MWKNALHDGEGRAEKMGGNANKSFLLYTLTQDSADALITFDGICGQTTHQLSSDFDSNVLTGAQKYVTSSFSKIARPF